MHADCTAVMAPDCFRCSIIAAAFGARFERAVPGNARQIIIAGVRASITSVPSGEPSNERRHGSSRRAGGRDEFLGWAGLLRRSWTPGLSIIFSVGRNGDR